MSRKKSELIRIIENWIKENEIEGKEGICKLQEHIGGSKGTIGAETEGLIFDDVLAIHRPLSGYSGHRVSHLPTGGFITDFDTEEDARRFIQSVIHLVDWSFANPNDISNLPKNVIINLADYCKGKNVTSIWLEQIVCEIRNRKLANLLDEAKQALLIVSAGIWRHKEKNACGLAGAAVAVHAVEDVLKKLESEDL